VRKVSFLSIFLTFFKISLFTIGGGYAMVPVLAKNLEKKEWMNKDDFYDLLAHSQSIPGSVAFNLSLLVGKEIGGLSGSVAGGVGVILPPFFAIILVGALLSKFSNSVVVEGFLKGAYGAVIGLIGGILYKIIISRRWNILEIAFMVLGAILLVLKSKYVLLIFILIVFGVWMGDKKWKS